MNPDRPFTLVLSGGGLKGLAHIGVLRALEERHLVPGLVVGSSIGSLIGAAWAAGASVAQMEARALAVRRRDVFQVARVDVALRRLLAPALYRREPLDQLVRGLIGDITFRQRTALGELVEDAAKAVGKGFEHEMSCLTYRVSMRALPAIGHVGVTALLDKPNKNAPAGAKRWRTFASGVKAPVGLKASALFRVGAF